MARNVYECMFIFDANRYARNSTGVVSKATDVIQKLGGELLASRLWNEQRLAYPIEGHRKGTYWLTYFSIESTSIADLSRQFGLNEDILRHLTLKIDPRLVDALVAHARGESAQPASEEGGGDKEAEVASEDAATVES